MLDTILEYLRTPLIELSGTPVTTLTLVTAIAIIVVARLIGSVIGGTMGLRIPMTAVPQRTALSHSLGALAACLVGISEYFRHSGELSKVVMTPLGFEGSDGPQHLAESLMVARLLPPGVCW